MHHRFSTHGTESIDNVHPFCVLSKDNGDPIDLYMMHNGVITRTTPDKDDPRSDTCIFVEDVLQPILKANPELLEDESFQELIGGYIGSANKLTFLDNIGTVTIINEDSGTWKDNVWLSNTGSITKYVAPIYATSSHNRSNFNYAGNAYKANNYNGNTSSNCLVIGTKEDDSQSVGKNKKDGQMMNSSTGTGTAEKKIQHEDSLSQKPFTLRQLEQMPDTDLDDLGITNPDLLVDSMMDSTYTQTRELVTRMGDIALGSFVQELIEQLRDAHESAYEEALETLISAEEELEEVRAYNTRY